MVAFRTLILLGLVSLAAAAPMLEERGSTKEGSMGASYFGEQTGCPDISDYTKAHLKTKSYVGVYRANTHGRCGQWVAIKHGDKTIRAKIIDSTAQDKQNIIAGLRVYERFGLDEHQRYDIQWAFCDSTDKDDCPEDL